MKQQLEHTLRLAVEAILAEHGKGDGMPIVLSRPKRKEHGDYASNISMPLAGRLGMRPKEVARRLIDLADWPPAVLSTDIAAPGFINIKLQHGLEAQVLVRIIEQGTSYGCVHSEGGPSANIEYVSANPTGPMHVGHGRGAVVGDAIASVLAARGVKVHREYYINDAGAQIAVLANSVWLRMRELNGESITLPEGAYPGEYVIDMARQILASHEFEKVVNMHEEERNSLLARAAVKAMLDMIRDDLSSLGISFDLFFSESELHESGRVQGLIDHLRSRGLVYKGILPPPKGKEVVDYQAVEQLLFRTTDFGDDVDRPLAKQDGSATYFAADIAYHMDKYERGFDRQIDVWGADHGGYVTRVQAAMQALTGKKNQPEVLLVQMVNLIRGGEPVRMSKRSGAFVTLREVVDEVGRDAVRFNFLTRKSESQLDFDLETAKQKSDENPVYYVQYAHARVCSILSKAKRERIHLSEPEDVDAGLLCSDEEQTLLKQLLSYPEMLEKAASRLEPYRVATFLTQLAASLHTYYHKHRVIGVNDALCQARLMLLRAVGQVLKNGLGLLGASAPEHM